MDDHDDPMPDVGTGESVVENSEVGPDLPPGQTSGYSVDGLNYDSGTSQHHGIFATLEDAVEYVTNHAMEELHQLQVTAVSFFRLKAESYAKG